MEGKVLENVEVSVGKCTLTVGHLSDTPNTLHLILVLHASYMIGSSKPTQLKEHQYSFNDNTELKQNRSPIHACMRGGNAGSRWPQGGCSGWFPHGGCWSNEPGPPHDGGPGSDPPGPLQRPPSLGGPPLQFPWSLWSFHMPS